MSDFGGEQNIRASARLKLDLSNELVLLVGSLECRLEDFTAILLLHEYVLEHALAAAHRDGTDGSKEQLYAAQKVMPFQALEWTIDALLVQLSEVEKGQYASDLDLWAIARGSIYNPLLAQTLSSDSAEEELEELRSLLALSRPAFLRLLRITASWHRFVVKLAQGQSESVPFGVTFGLPGTLSIKTNAKLAAWRKDQRDSVSVLRYFDSSKYEWATEVVALVRANWWHPDEVIEVNWRQGDRS